MFDSFVMDRLYIEAINSLPDDEKLSLFKAVCYYGLDKVEPDGLTGAAAAMFKLIKDHMDNVEPEPFDFED